ELIKEFSLERVTPSPAIFDFEKLYWLNRHYLKSADPQRVASLSLRYFQAKDLVSEDPGAEEHEWLNKVIALLVPYVDRLDEIREKANFLFRFDPQAAIAKEDNQPL